MRSALICLLVLITLPYTGLCQDGLPAYKTIEIGGSRFSVHEQSISFGGTDPVFLVPTDTTGNLVFTGVIHGVRVVGRFAPCSFILDTTYAEDPSDGNMLQICSTAYSPRKQGEWDYFYGKGFCYHEFYDKGVLASRDSVKYFFGNNRKGTTVPDSMARIRSYVDLYIKKGDGSAPRRENAIE